MKFGHLQGEKPQLGDLLTMITNHFHLFVAICCGYTSLKTKMETQNHDLEKVTPFERWDLVGWQWYIKFPFLGDQTMQSMVILKDFP